jgi:hypothetical protein
MRYLLSIFFVGFSLLAHADCENIFYGEINYTDLDKSGQIVHRTNIAPMREWSSQSKFERILVEKNASLIGIAADRVQLLVQLAGVDFKTEERLYALADWRKNDGFLRAAELDIKKLIDAQKRPLTALHLAYVVEGEKFCEYTVPVKNREME